MVSFSFGLSSGKVEVLVPQCSEDKSTNSLLKHIPAKQWIPGRVVGLMNGCQESSPRRWRDEGLKVSLGWSEQTGKSLCVRAMSHIWDVGRPPSWKLATLGGKGGGGGVGMVQNSGSTLEWLQDWDSGISDGLGCKTNFSLLDFSLADQWEWKNL